MLFCDRCSEYASFRFIKDSGEKAVSLHRKVTPCRSLSLCVASRYGVGASKVGFRKVRESCR